jgi:biofilm PGA synthesis protein PgaA
VNAYYFNPAQDASVSLTLDNDLLTYRFYETAFNQRLAVSIGQYWQQYFGSNPVGNIQYEHRWKTADRLEIAYGGIRGYHYYDGNLTESWFMYLNLNVRF